MGLSHSCSNCCGSNCCNSVKSLLNIQFKKKLHDNSTYGNENSNTGPQIIESYDAKNNYFYLLQNIILIQSKFRQTKSLGKLYRLKEIDKKENVN